MQMHRKISTSLTLAAFLLAPTTFAAQLDVQAPNGFGQFGNRVWVLTNGNIVVAAPYESVNDVSQVGAMYLYSSTGQMISRLTGSVSGDMNFSSVAVLPNGNFVVSSPEWNNGGASSAGAVTWVDGVTGLDGAISASNSLVGTHADDQVGYVTVLANGNYVVSSYTWDNGSIVDAGAVTWSSGDGTGPFGPVSLTNSLVGTTNGDGVGSLTVLPNGNYVVCSRYWSNGQATNAGAVTWRDGYQAAPGAISASNSMVGSTLNDQICSRGVTVVGNSNYVVASPEWHMGTDKVGAATWADGSQPFSGAISSGNSLVGSTATRFNATLDIVALSDGNYVVVSPSWGQAQNDNRGAVTWASGGVGLSGMISQANSLTGTKVNDYVGNGGVTALSDGSYAVMSTVWNNESVQGVGALTWMRGGAKGVAIVSTNNSFIGTEEHPCNILIVVPLANANFVVQCIAFGSRNGSVTLGSGTDGLSGTASPTRSLMVSGTLVVALSDGNYAVASTESVAGTTKIGSVTWGDGDTGTVGNISAANSFFLSDAGDYIDGLDLKPVGNGNYVVANPFKDVDGRFNAGSVTWLKGGSPSTGTASSANSLVGSSSNDRIGADRIDTFANGDYVVSSPFYDRRPLINSGAHTLARGNGPIVGVIDDTNSVRGFSAAFASTHFAYDAVRDLFVVGQPRADLFSIFQLDSLFSNGF